MVNIYKFTEHEMEIQGTKDYLLDFVQSVRSSHMEGTLSDLAYQIERAFNIDNVNDGEDISDTYLVNRSHKIYVLTGSWATEDDCDSFVEIFSTYKTARKIFEACIADELESDWFKEHDNMVIDNESKDFWCAYQEGDYLLNHSQFEIKEMEVQ